MLCSSRWCTNTQLVKTGQDRQREGERRPQTGSRTAEVVRCLHTSVAEPGSRAWIPAAPPGGTTPLFSTLLGFLTTYFMSNKVCQYTDNTNVLTFFLLSTEETK